MPESSGLGRIIRNVIAGWLCIALARSCYVALVLNQYAAVALLRPFIMQFPWMAMTPAIAWLTLRATSARSLQRRTWLISQVPMAVVAALVATGWTYGAWTLIQGEAPAAYATWILGQIDGLLFNYAAVVGAVLAAHMFHNYRSAKARQIKLETDLFRARLHALMLQLQPHFLFNTLNAVAELVHRHQPAALKALTNLRSLLKRSVDGALPSRVHVSEELSALEAYVDIERMRFGAALTVNIHADEDVQSALMPPFLLQPIVENAIRHGVQRQGGGVISVLVHRQQNDLILEISDDGAGLGDYTEHDEGMGLGLTRRRLDELFGTGYSMALLGRQDGGAIVRLTLPTDDHQVIASSRQPRVPRRSTREKVLTTAVIFVAWTVVGLLGGLAEIAREAPDGGAMAGGGGFVWRHIMDGWLWALMTVALFFLVRQATWREYSVPAFLVLHLTVLLLYGFLRVRLGLALGLEPLPAGGLARLSVLLWHVYAYSFTAALTHSWILRERSRIQGGIVENLERKMAEASFDELRWSVDPHFMMGTLDHIATLAGSDPAAADRAIENLSQLLRRMLGANRDHERALGDEANLLCERWGIPASTPSGPAPTIDIPQALSELKLPALLLSALLGLILPPRTGGLALGIEARRTGRMLDLEISLRTSNGTQPPTKASAQELLKLRRWLAIRFGPDADCGIRKLVDGLAAHAAIPLPAAGAPS